MFCYRKLLFKYFSIVSLSFDQRVFLKAWKLWNPNQKALTTKLYTTLIMNIIVDFKILQNKLSSHEFWNLLKCLIQAHDATALLLGCQNRYQTSFFSNIKRHICSMNIQVKEWLVSLPAHLHFITKQFANQHYC